MEGGAVRGGRGGNGRFFAELTSDSGGDDTNGVLAQVGAFLSDVDWEFGGGATYKPDVV